MRVLWTPRAAADLDEVVEFIAADKPDAAIRVAQKISDQVLQLATAPEIGRRGLLPGTRELVFPKWPYIVIYRVDREEAAIRVLRIRHAARLLP